MKRTAPLGRFRCWKCGHEYDSPPPPPACPRCGHLYSTWLNYTRDFAKPTS